MGFDLSKLNEEQLKPVLLTEGAVMVTAGAGSGKTRLLTHRIAHIIEDLHVPPYKILAITFTNKAAKEMRERIADMINCASDVWIYTFHSFCAKVLREHINRIGYSSNFTIYAEAEKTKVLKYLIKTEQVDDDFLKKTASIISDAKSRNIDYDKLLAQFSYIPDINDIVDLYKKYEDELKKNNALDFDDLLSKMLYLLKNNQEVREILQNKFKYILVDEFQDTNAVQYQIIKALGVKHRNIFIVGDEDQSIYSWRGASLDNIYDFRKDFNCTEFKLEQNYRSSKNILNLANKIIVNNTSRLDKNLWTENADGARIESYCADSESAEADYIVNAINSLVKYSGYNYSDFAVLMRLNALSRSVEERLVSYGIPYKVFGGFKFYERKEIKDIIAYLKLLVNSSDKEALLRIINFPKRGIGESAIEKLSTYADLNKKSIFDVVCEIQENFEISSVIVKKVMPLRNIFLQLLNAKSTLTLDELVYEAIKVVGFKDIYSGNSEENDSKNMNIEFFLSAVVEFVKDNPNATLEDYLQVITLYSDVDELSDKNNCVNLATIHASKGLEFKVVFVIGLEETTFPSSRSIDDKAQMEEERRLMYVAITRAMERLYLTRANTRFLYGQRKLLFPSRFLSELDLLQKISKVEMTTYRENSIKPTFVANTTIKKVENTNIYTAGAKVRHKKFGEGIILSITDDKGNRYAEILFDSMGKMNLSLGFAPLEIVD